MSDAKSFPGKTKNLKFVKGQPGLFKDLASSLISERRAAIKQGFDPKTGTFPNAGAGTFSDARAETSKPKPTKLTPKQRQKLQVKKAREEAERREAMKTKLVAEIFKEINYDPETSCLDFSHLYSEPAFDVPSPEEQSRIRQIVFERELAYIRMAKLGHSLPDRSAYAFQGARD